MKGEREMETKEILNRWLASVPDAICFTQKMKLYLPTCCGNCETEVLQLRDRVNEIFGGSTVYEDTQGCWFDPKDKKVLCEPIKVIEVAHNCTDKETLKQLVDAITDYAEKTKQHSVSIHNGTFYIAETERLKKVLIG